MLSSFLAVAVHGLYITEKGLYLQLTKCITSNGSVRRPMFILICLRENGNNDSLITSIFILIHVSVWNDHMNAENEQLIYIMYAQQMVLKLLRGT